ncbi:MAG: carbon storage regulator [Planctomycetes bacterium]|nr:carbon storage regulator [Planctomycetota bacterium]
MLVLTRKRTESIKIGEDIVITVIHTSRGCVKLGIQAPSNVRVLRAELSDRPVAPLALDAADDHGDDEPGLIFSADQFPNQFSADYVATLEDQALLSLAK